MAYVGVCTGTGTRVGGPKSTFYTLSGEMEPRTFRTTDACRSKGWTPIWVALALPVLGACAGIWKSGTWKFSFDLCFFLSLLHVAPALIRSYTSLSVDEMGIGATSLFGTRRWLWNEIHSIRPVGLKAPEIELTRGSEIWKVRIDDYVEKERLIEKFEGKITPRASRIAIDYGSLYRWELFGVRFVALTLLLMGIGLRRGFTFDRNPLLYMSVLALIVSAYYAVRIEVDEEGLRILYPLGFTRTVAFEEAQLFLWGGVTAERMTVRKRGRALKTFKSDHPAYIDVRDLFLAKVEPAAITDSRFSTTMVGQDPV